MSKATITQVRSSIDRPKDQKDTLKSLGLGKIGKYKEVTLSPQIEGMIKKIAHLIKVS